MRLVLVDGAVNEELSDLSALPTDARVGAHLRRSELPGRSPSAQHVLALVSCAVTTYRTVGPYLGTRLPPSVAFAIHVIRAHLYLYM